MTIQAPVYSTTFERAQDSLKDRLKLILGAIVFPGQTQRWRSFVQDHPVLEGLAADYPRVAHKIYRPYLSNDLRCADRVDVLMSHYRHVFGAGLGSLVQRAARRPIVMARFAGKAGDAFELHLHAINVGHREGEFTLQLMHAGRGVYAASFTLLTQDGQKCIHLGAVQGLRSESGREVVRHVTRELHGCRPPKLMVEAVRAFGLHLGCARMILVSNENRITINGRRRARISSDYDQAWADMRATRRRDGNFELACAEEAVDLGAVASNKRAEVRRRLALIKAAGMAIGATLARERGVQAYALAPHLN